MLGLNGRPFSIWSASSPLFPVFFSLLFSVLCLNRSHSAARVPRCFSRFTLIRSPAPVLVDFPERPTIQRSMSVYNGNQQ